ncbi:hypothetical protein ACOQFV_12200 [Nocardiopsis changdeensis]|uniref:Aldos-2-ulose dehydratase beta-propeller domain-containing protein n=1 Tax=Nocardiopsis changdeensis TaxID=2831969 RepID=A0ABX8BQK1_9ACTN|nr:MULTISPECIES: hypothetical protein [Nocardiopsis]QUX24327.1 hypothetical protein KGD84_08625 [Nocardiopsis changdeensis]QYX34718.1 hypothetical protein K1J57_18085 [Nocardiopsis sp. MT53]
MTAHARPAFTPETIASDTGDGYWVHRTGAGLVTSGLTRQKVERYGHSNGSWTRSDVFDFGTGGLNKPVALDHARLGTGPHPDLVVCHNYGQCMFGCGNDDGKISWLKPDANGAYTRKEVASLVATHRVRLGGFTRDPAQGLQLAAFPVVGRAAPGTPEAEKGEKGFLTPYSPVLYDIPADPAGEWRPASAPGLDRLKFRIIHAVVAGRFPGTPRPDLQSFVVASHSGLDWIGPGRDGVWIRRHIGDGVPPRASQEIGRPPNYKETPLFGGSGNVAVGRIGGQAASCIVTVEPFHGNTVAVYTRPWGTGSPFERPWERRVVKVFPQPIESDEEGPKKSYDAVGHHVVAADFDGDGDDEFLIAMRGPQNSDPNEPTQGVLYLKADSTGRVVVREWVSGDSTAHIAVLDANGDGRLDFATTSYHTVGYYKSRKTEVRLFRNTFARPVADPVIPSSADG